MVGRIEEIRTLDEIMARHEAQFVAVYGRRRVGKTYLIRNYFKNHFAFYHTGTANEGMVDQLVNFRDSLREYGLRDCPALRDWKSAFRQLRQLIEGNALGMDGKKVVFIDEMPWLDTPRSKFVSALEYFWNSWASSRVDVVLIVCGSASSWILDKIINNHGGLHNRITDQIRLAPFTLGECERLAKSLGLSFSRKDLCSLYMVFGGIPYYWSFLRKGDSVAQNVDRLLFSETGKLRGEFDSMMKSLFKRGDVHRRIVETLSEIGIGMSRNDLLRKTKLCDGNVFCRCLKDLEQSGFIRRYTAFGKSRKDSLYQLMDFFSLFHLRFVAGECNPDENFWSGTALSPRQKAWYGVSFERICLAHVRQLKAALGIAGVVTHVCSWRHVADEENPIGAQIDLLIDRADGVIDICEMKYHKGKFALKKEDEESLTDKREVFAAVTETAKTLQVVMVTAGELVDNIHSGIVSKKIGLDDLFV